MKIVIIGAYGTALNIADSISHACLHYGRKDDVLGFAIDNAALGDNIGGYPILCTPRDFRTKFLHYSDVKVIFALHKPNLLKERALLMESYKIPDEKYYTFISPFAYIAENVKIGIGNAILSNCSIQSKVVIGNHNIINANVVIEHDTVIENSNFIAAGACIGSLVKVKTASFIGLNSTVRENTMIDNYAFIGMSSNVLSHVNESEIVYGNPARVRAGKNSEKEAVK